ncbi:MULTISPECIES: TolC family protein [Flavobacteriaceae]|uniref:TolC family protein n=1 Tax=Gaetbulibacter jejuensis TaxID=584607 RepID=A0ABN1JBR2_9FLAO|nr:TolC family protein [Meridianimaribacter sp. CL38]TBV25276.1 TolC family protein [Meridianimaribacter sp. CL38]
MKKAIFVFTVLLTFSFQAQTKKWTLEECVDHALQNNITVKQSELDLEQSEINKKDAIGNFLPTLNASVTHSWSIGLGQDPVTFDAVNSTTKNLSGGISSSLNIYDGLRNINQLHRSNLEILASRYQLDKIKDDISLLVANSFLQILFNKEQLKVLQAQQVVSQQELERTNELVDAGVLPRGDLLEIQATIATQEQQIVNAENTVLLSRIQLAQLLLIQEYETFDIVDIDYQVPTTMILEQSPDAIVSKAKETRYDIKIAETNQEIANDNLKIAKGALQPTLRGSYNFGSNYFTSQLFDTPDFETQLTDNKSHNFSLSLSIPIFNGFAASNNVKRNKVNLERAKVQLEQANLDMETAVYQAYNDTKGALKAYEAAQKTLEAREEAFNYSRERYNVGLLNAFDYNQSQNRFEAAQSDVIRTKYDYIFKLKVLEFYFGIPITDIN